MTLRPDWCEALRAQFQKPGRFADKLPDYPPASEEQLRVTEEHLGFALPPTLRRLYAEVANGGDVFRSGVVVLGVVGGCPDFYLPNANMTIDQLVRRSSGWRLNERVDRALQRHPGVYVQSEEAPDSFVPICAEGAEISIDLDGLSGRLYHRWCGDDVLSYRASRGQPIEPGIEGAYMQAISFYTASVEEWIEQQMSGIRLPSAEVTELTQAMLREQD